MNRVFNVMRTIFGRIKNKIWDSNNVFFAFCIALATTCIVFSPYLGQKLFSDTVTFQKLGDQLQFTFPAFTQAWKVFTNYGVDIACFNGATESVFRIPIYPVYVLFSFLGKIIGFRFAFILFYAAHMFAAIYFGILTCIQFFGLSKRSACLCALCSLTALFSGAWFYSLYVNAALLFPCLYCALRVIKERQKVILFLCAVPFTFLMLGGYITVAVFEFMFLFVVSVLYGKLWRDDNPKLIIVTAKCALPFFIAGLVILPYYLLQLYYTSNVLSSSGAITSMAGATALPLIPKDWITVISYAFDLNNYIEAPYTIYIGFAWLVILVAYAAGYHKIKISNGKKTFVITLLIFCVLFSLTIVGTYLPFQYWFYASAPIIGSMHLPIRYMLFLMPAVFLGLTILWENTQFEIKKSQYTAAIISIIGVILFFLFKRTNFEYVNENILIVELAFLLAFLICVRKNTRSIATVFCIIFCTVIFPLQYSFYQEMTATKSDYETKSIAFSEEKQKELNTFIISEGLKDSYKIISYESDSSVPVYIPDNYAYYHDDATLTHYLGYALHNTIPGDYAERFPWFDRVDWEYIANTRGDFAILNPTEVDSNIELFNTLIDWEYSPYDLDANHTIYKLNKFIPSYYTGSSYIEDTSDSYDNGYFYCPNIPESQVSRFETDKSTFFTLELSAEEPTEVAFLLYPNRHYVYYVDDKIVEPTVYEMQSFISITSGDHKIEVRCENAEVQIALIIIVCYYIVTCIVTVVFLFFAIKKGKIK